MVTFRSTGATVRMVNGASATRVTCFLQSSHRNLKDFEWTEQERPLIAHDQFEGDAELPVIDMSGECSKWAAHMAKASQEWGFFQVRNHGVPEELIKRMQKQARGFFEGLSPAEKAAVLRDPMADKPMGYACGGAGTRLTSDLPWMESLQLPCRRKDLDAYLARIWPHHHADGNGNPEFSSVAEEFNRVMRGLTLRIMDALAHGLLVGQGQGQHGQHGHGIGGWATEMGGRHVRNSVIRFNYYPPCPQPRKTLGLGAHSDPHLLTVLHQDSVGGLQICKDGRWIAVKPIPNSFVINIGDALQVWSNDVYKSVEHRVVCNSLKSRLSMAFFMNPMDDAIIAPIKSNDPPLYRPFTWKEYRQCMYTHRPRGKSNLLRYKLSSETPMKSNSSQDHFL